MPNDVLGHIDSFDLATAVALCAGEEYRIFVICGEFDLAALKTFQDLSVCLIFAYSEPRDEAVVKCKAFIESQIGDTLTCHNVSCNDHT